MMTHIYKVYRAAAGTLLLTAALAACTDDSREPMQENETPREGIFFSVTATQGEGAETRVTHEHNGDQDIDVAWADNDKIYVGKLSTDVYDYLSSGILSSLDIVAGGAGKTTAQFDGTIANEHLPNSGEPLYAVYGKANKIRVYYGDIRYDYTGQRQTTNDDMKHAADYDFMTASTEYIPGSNHHFSFSHVGSMMQFALHGLGGKTVKKLTLSTYDGSNAFDSSKAVSLDLGAEGSNGISLGSSETLKAYLMMAPNTKTAGKSLVLYVTTADDKYFAITLTGANIAAGKLYTVDATPTEYSFAGTGEQGSPYEITSAGDLTKLAVMTNSGMIETSGQYFQLTANINMAGEKAWVPIGTVYNSFKGNFSGLHGTNENYSISDLPGKTVDTTSSYPLSGLFGRAQSPATIKNVTVTGALTLTGVGADTSVGGIVGKGSCTIENCISERTINVSGNTGPTTGTGGILGNGDNGYKIVNCENRGNVKSDGKSGGIIGRVYGGGEIKNCKNSGSITTTNTSYPAGGIIGYVYLSATNQSFTLTNCVHEGGSPVTGPGCIIGKYGIDRKYSGSGNFSTITITNSIGSTATPISGSASESVTGKWPAAQ